MQNENIILLCDRGACDIKAYIKEREFKKILKRLGHNPDALYERYNGVCHLVTAADGAEDFYTTRNNTARIETLEQARELDTKTIHAWIDHPHYFIMDNSTDFQTKMRRLLKAVCRTIGIPAPLEIERRFLVYPPKKIPIPYTTALIEQTYLRSWNEINRRIRKRTQGTHITYYQTYKRRISKLTRVENEKTISARDYTDLLLHEQDPNYDIIRKKRHCFTWKYQRFELDEFTEPTRLAGKWILEIELTEENDTVTIPDFISVIEEVTGDERFSNQTLAYKGTKLIA